MEETDLTGGRWSDYVIKFRFERSQGQSATDPTHLLTRGHFKPTQLYFSPSLTYTRRIHNRKTLCFE